MPVPQSQIDSSSQPFAHHRARLPEALPLEDKLQAVLLVESAGANLMHVRELFIEDGPDFATQVRMRAAGIAPQAAMHGRAACGAFLPGMSQDLTAVRGRANAFLAGPPPTRSPAERQLGFHG